MEDMTESEKRRLEQAALAAAKKRFGEDQVHTLDDTPRLSVLEHLQQLPRGE